MRTLFIILCLLLTNLLAKGQVGGAMIVNDPMNYAQIANLVAEGKAHTEKMEKQFQILKTSKEAIERVNQAIKALDMISNLIQIGDRTLKNITRTTEALRNMKHLSPQYINYAVQLCIRFQQHIVENISFATAILTNGKFKLNDYERIKQLQEISQNIETFSRQINRIYQLSYRIENRYKTIKSLQ